MRIVNWNMYHLRNDRKNRESAKKEWDRDVLNLWLEMALEIEHVKGLCLGNPTEENETHYCVWKQCSELLHRWNYDGGQAFIPDPETAIYRVKEVAKLVTAKQCPKHGKRLYRHVEEDYYNRAQYERVTTPWILRAMKLANENPYPPMLPKEKGVA